MIKSENKIDCQLLAYAVETAMAFVNVSASILLACRVVCLFRGRAHFVVSTSLIVASMGLTAIWFLGVRDIIAVWNPEGGCKCWILPLVSAKRDSITYCRSSPSPTSHLQHRRRMPTGQSDQRVRLEVHLHSHL